MAETLRMGNLTSKMPARKILLFRRMAAEGGVGRWKERRNKKGKKRCRGGGR